jgi:hypothetical protein
MLANCSPVIHGTLSAKAILGYVFCALGAG